MAFQCSGDDRMCIPDNKLTQGLTFSNLELFFKITWSKFTCTACSNSKNEVGYKRKDEKPLKTMLTHFEQEGTVSSCSRLGIMTMQFFNFSQQCLEEKQTYVYSKIWHLLWQPIANKVTEIQFQIAMINKLDMEHKENFGIVSVINRNTS